VASPNYYLDVKKKLALGEQKSPAFSRFSKYDPTKNIKEAYYNQPHSFLEDTEKFIDTMET